MQPIWYLLHVTHLLSLLNTAVPIRAYVTKTNVSSFQVYRVKVCMQFSSLPRTLPACPFLAHLITLVYLEKSTNYGTPHHTSYFLSLSPSLFYSVVFGLVMAYARVQSSKPARGINLSFFVVLWRQKSCVELSQMGVVFRFSRSLSRHSCTEMG